MVGVELGTAAAGVGARGFGVGVAVLLDLEQFGGHELVQVFPGAAILDAGGRRNDRDGQVRATVYGGEAV